MNLFSRFRFKDSTNGDGISDGMNSPSVDPNHSDILDHLEIQVNKGNLDLNLNGTPPISDPFARQPLPEMKPQYLDYNGRLRDMDDPIADVDADGIPDDIDTNIDLDHDGMPDVDLDMF